MSKMHNSGQQLWLKAKGIIPGGNMLLSKRPEMFLPDYWPAYFSKTEGCYVWDLDGKRYTDFSLMGVGTNALGYNYPSVDDAVSRAIKLGNLSTLNCPEEVFLAEQILELHPFAEMARFCRTGGEANSVAIRISRAATGREAVAVCGYHGWHDWYLAANHKNDQLAKHLLPGLAPNGVPKGLGKSTVAFQYNKIEELEAIANNYKLAAIKMEVVRNQNPQNNFLKKVREIANKTGAVLIFDECTTGFRETFGGIHKKFEIEPDIAVFGKTLGNGFAITAVIGRKSVMDAAQNTFISSTFWTERIGPTAALATLAAMKAERSWELIPVIGNTVKEGWVQIAKNHGIDIKISGIPSLCSFSFNNDNAQILKTLVCQEMLKKGYLASTVFYPCIKHTTDVVDRYLDNFDEVFGRLKPIIDDPDAMNEALEGPTCHSGFARLN